MTSELGRRIAFTPGAPLVYRIGSYLPLADVTLDNDAKIQGGALVNVGGRRS
jgi:hypothetical protein